VAEESKNIKKAEKLAGADARKLVAEKKKELWREQKKNYWKNKPHTYTPLGETSLGSKDLYDIYGIVIDA
jgi:hypothetical protein